MDADTLLTIQQLSELLQTTPANIEYMLRHGRGPPITRLAFKMRRIKYSDYLAWIRSRVQAPRPGRQPRFRASNAEVVK